MFTNTQHADGGCPCNNLRLIPLCLKTLAHPCGVALSPDEKNIYVGARFFRAKNIKQLVSLLRKTTNLHPNGWNLIKPFNLGTDHPNLHPNFTRCFSIWEMMISFSWATTKHPSVYWSKRVRNLRHLSLNELVFLSVFSNPQITIYIYIHVYIYVCIDKCKYKYKSFGINFFSTQILIWFAFSSVGWSCTQPAKCCWFPINIPVTQWLLIFQIDRWIVYSTGVGKCPK